MKIVNVTTRTREIGVTGQRVEPGEAVEVDDALGKSLLEQPANWGKSKPEPKSTKTADAVSKEN